MQPLYSTVAQLREVARGRARLDTANCIADYLTSVRRAVLSYEWRDYATGVRARLGAEDRALLALRVGAAGYHAPLSSLPRELFEAPPPPPPSDLPVFRHACRCGARPRDAFDSCRVCEIGTVLRYEAYDVGFPGFHLAVYRDGEIGEDGPRPDGMGEIDEIPPCAELIRRSGNTWWYRLPDDWRAS